MIELIQGDCLEVMKDIESGSVDMVLADPPYGTTACKWDSVIDLERMWEQLKRVIKPNGAIVMTASQPFASALIMSNVEMFKYCWVWEKTKAANFAQAKNMPLKTHEDICVFSTGVVGHKKQTASRMNYTPQGIDKTPRIWTARSPRRGADKDGHNFARAGELSDRVQEASGYPKSVIKIGSVHNPSHHPTQKPVELMEYLVETYTDTGDTVLDFAMGSGTTGVACKKLGRDFIGIEKELNYVATAVARTEGTSPAQLVGTGL